MELKKVNYRSAVFFAVAALLMYFLIGVLQLLVSRDPAYVVLYGSVSALQVLLYTPFLGAAVSYIFIVFMILIYNIVAKKYPISWSIKK